MNLPGFFRLGWIVQLIVGVALFSVSFLIENLVLKSFFAAPLIALTLAAALELGKAAAIVWHRYLSLSTGGGYPWATRIFSTLFRFGLLGLSVVCSLLYFGVQLDRPNLQAVRTAELAAVDRDLQERLGRLDAEQANRTASDEARRRTQYADTRRVHQRQVDEMETLLRAEMDNVVGGVFKGPRYKEIQERLMQARAARDTALSSLSIRQAREAEEQSHRLTREYSETRQSLIAEADARRMAIRAATYDTDGRVNDPLVVALMRMSADVIHHQITPPQFVFIFSLFISLLMEIGILLAFDTVTLILIPALEARHQEQMMNEALQAEITGETKRHRAAMERVRKGAERAFEQATVKAQRAA